MQKAHAALLCLLCSTHGALAEEALAGAPPENGSAGLARIQEGAGMLMLDYHSFTLTNGRKFDLFGTHYLHQVNDWLYAGVGFSSPHVEGDFGGFFAADVTLHAQKELFGNWFVDAGIAFGAGAGGTSVRGIKQLSGDGTYVKKYAGFGYSTDRINYGVNIADISISNSLIDDTTLNFFVQVPLSPKVGSYGDYGTRLDPDDFARLGPETILSLQYSNLNQINPTGKYTGDIGLVSPQFSQFFDEDNYWFVGLDLGLSGLVWYNQAQGGFGRRVSLTDNINLYGQIGIGSGGWVTDTIDTGPGLVFYPRIKAEYKFDNGIAPYFSAGYLIAPLGTSRNWSIGAGINYHMPHGNEGLDDPDSDYALTQRGLRVNLLQRRMFNVVSNGAPVADLNLTAAQVDYAFADNWYVPVQVAAATNSFKGFAGYVEGFGGLGWQSDLFLSDKLQGFAQIMAGMNDVEVNAKTRVGPLLYPSVGLNYSLSDEYAIYAQVGKMTSLGQYLTSNPNYFEGVTAGVGLTYRFSLPSRVSR